MIKNSDEMILLNETVETEPVAIEEAAENTDYAARDNKTSDPVRLYLRTIGAVKRLTQQEEQKLGWRIYAGKQAEKVLPSLSAADEIADCRRTIAEGEEAQRKLVEAELRLVVSVAKKYASEGMELLDMVEEGNMGLMKAAAGFDVTKGFRFSTYAFPWIKQSIQRGINKQGKLIRTSGHICESIRKIENARRRLSAESGREATNAEVAKYLDMELSKVDEALRNSMSVISLDNPVGEDGKSELQDIIEDKTVLSPEDRAIDSYFNDLIAAIIDSLPERQADIIRYRYGFYGRTYTLEEIGKVYGLSGERVRQICEDGLRRIRRDPKHYSQLKEYYMC